MKSVKWLGETRTIPKHGVATKGENIELPSNIADSFIKQGLAKVKPKANRTTEGDS